MANLCLNNPRPEFMYKYFTFLLTIVFALTAGNLWAQQQEIKKVSLKKSSASLKIDGIIDEAAWQNAPLANNFIEFEPNPGVKEDPKFRTEVKILYDDKAIYFAAKMYETFPDSIARELGNRDQIGNTDFLGIIIDTYNDKINAQGFFVTAAGVQFDAKYSAGGNEDESWNAVWISEVKIDKDGWTAEFEIPYSALRFANSSNQTWGLNMLRNRRTARKRYFWNEVNPKTNGFINQEGEMINIEKVEAPVRLAFFPYLSSNINHYPFNTPGIKNTKQAFNGGMDVKYGISESFTLDLTLIPDFGQVQSDNQVLNVTPFEIKFDENRQFFTEGTELFNKGNLFYSRRIGSTPLNYGNVALNTGDRIIENPTETKLVNATKVSGRTKSGLGIGLFNATTNSSNAVIEDLNGNRRLYQTAPLTNYNILVFDQNLKNNSSVTLINTTVYRQGRAYDANVSGFLFDLNNKGNKYKLQGSIKMSNVFEPGDKVNTGFSNFLFFGKTSGNFTWNVNQTITDNKYEINDLGILFNNNYIERNLNLNYNQYKPGKWYNQYGIYSSVNFVQRYKPNTFQEGGVYAGYFVVFKNFWDLNLEMDYQPEGNNYYEARVPGVIFPYSQQAGIGFNGSSNSAKKYSAGFNLRYRTLTLFNGKSYGIGFFQQYRISNKFSVGTETDINPRYNNGGFATFANNQPVFNQRDIKTVENILNLKFTFNNKMGVTTRVRHYWSKLVSKEYYSIDENKNLFTYNNPLNADRNFNAFNVDFIYVWRFAPGSEFSFSWKDAGFYDGLIGSENYGRNLRNTINGPQNNNLSLKILYYLDYLQLKKRPSK